MDKLRKLIIFTFFSIITAHSVAAESLIKTLTRCDASFFKQMEKTPSLKSIPEQLYQFDLNKNDFMMNINYTSAEGLELTHFYVQYADLDNHQGNAKIIEIANAKGKFYFWGFSVKQPLNTVVDALSKLTEVQKVAERLYIYHPMIKNDKQGWVDNTSAMAGVAPTENSAEKVFMINAQDNAPVSVICTLQGRLSQQDLLDAGLVK